MKLVGTMAQDSGKKREKPCIKEKSNVSKRKANPHAIERIRSSLETQTQSYAKKKEKKKRVVLKKKYIKLIQPQIVYTDLKRERKKLRNEAGQQGAIWRNNRHS